jgi:hypothetical protein
MSSWQEPPRLFCQKTNILCCTVFWGQVSKEEAAGYGLSEKERRSEKVIDESNPDTPIVKEIEERSLPEEAALFLDSLSISFSDPHYRSKINL